MLRKPSPGAVIDRDVRRQMLLDAADSVVRRLGASASMDDIAAAAGITKPILYRHFGDKGGLSRALAERYVGLLMDELQETFARSAGAAAGLATGIEAYVRFVERNSSAYQFLMNRAIAERPEAQTAVKEFISRLAAELAGGLRQQLERAGVDPGGADVWAHGIVGMVQLATDWWLVERPFSRSQLVEYLVQMLWSGFGGMGSRRPAKTIAREGGGK